VTPRYVKKTPASVPASHYSKIFPKFTENKMFNAKFISVMIKSDRLGKS
jgi:hypothetical protein